MPEPITIESLTLVTLLLYAISMNRTMKVQVGVERGAEAMDEGYRPEAGLRGCTGTAGLEAVLHRLKERKIRNTGPMSAG